MQCKIENHFQKPRCCCFGQQLLLFRNLIVKDIFEEYSLSTNVIYFCLSAATNHVQHNYVLKNLVPRLASLLCHSVLLVKGEPLGGKDLTGPICPSLFLYPLHPRPAKTGPFYYFTLSNVRRFYSLMESLWVGKG